MVRTDQGKVQQVLYNLLSNAIKFTPEGGKVRLEVARTGGGIELAVIDTGIGIRPEDMQAGTSPVQPATA